MNRREALKTSSLILGYSITAGTAAAVLSGCNADPSLDWTPNNFSTKQAFMVAELSEMIIPQTETPGAKEAMVDRFIDAIIDCYPPAERQKFLAQLDAFDLRIIEDHGKTFNKCTLKEKIAIMDEISSDSASEDHEFFMKLREWAVVGYCTSEAGATQHLAWDPFPGAPFQGCIDFSEVGKRWAL